MVTVWTSGGRRTRLRGIDLRRWLRIRRHAVPPSMIANATAAREAGDWRGACAATRVDVEFDLVAVERQYGRAAAGAIEEDLHHFAPDLLRWHLPRYEGRTALAPSTRV